MKIYKFLILFFLISKSLVAQNDFNNHFEQQIIEKNYLMIDKLRSLEVSDLIENNQVLNELKSQKNEKFLKALKNKDVQAIANALIFSEIENEIIDTQLIKVSKSSQGKDFINELRASMAYANFNDLDDEKFIAKVWNLCAEGMNEIIKVYGLGQKPPYPNIDSVSYDPKSDFFKYSVYSWAELIENKRIYEKEYFFTKSLDFAISLLYMNHRDEAIKYEPLSIYNQKAIELSKVINYKKYPYSSIIVLGNGPENYRDRLSALGKLNLQLGVMEFLKGKAPFIIVSGGHVHPYRSKYAEAFEMKKELIEVYGINEKHIIVDPYARHTTTNLRNATRLMIDYKIPIEKPSLVVTNIEHSNYTYGPKYIERSIEELGYKVGRFGERLSSTTIEFFPSNTCLQQNPLQPLDP